MEAKFEQAGIPKRNLTGWQERYMQPIVIALLVLAMFTGPIVLLEIIFPEQPWDALPWLILLVSAEGILTTHWLSTTERRVNRFVYRAAEITVIFLFLRLFTWLFVIDLPTISELEEFLLMPSSFIDPIYFAYAFLLFFAWQQTITMTRIFIKLQLDFKELNYYSRTSYNRYKLERPLPKNRKGLREDYIKQWVTGGLITGAFATLTTFDLSGFGTGTIAVRTIGRLGLRPAMLAALLVYFIGGLWLTGQAQLAMLRSRWLLQDTRLDRKMSRTWNRASLVLIGIIATIAAFLPIGSTVAISRILQLLTLAVIAIINLLFFLLTAVLFLITSLFITTGAEAPAEPFDPSRIVPEQFVMDPIEPPTPSPIFGGIFWIVVIVVVAAAVIFFLRGRGVPLKGSKFSTFIANAWLRLKAWLRNLWRGLGEQGLHLGQTIRERLQMAEKPAGGIFSLGRPPFRSLSPREKIRYYYLSIVRRAEERGVERGRSETPSEYAADLKENWPEANVEVETITDAFEMARYSPQTMTGDDLGLVKETWNRIKSAIRKRRS